MRYVILIHSNPASREIWDGFSAEEKADGFAAYGRIVDELTASGELIVTHALADPSPVSYTHLTLPTILRV